MHRLLSLGVLAISLLALVYIISTSNLQPTKLTHSKLKEQQVRAKLSNVSIPFIQNTGQTNKQVSFYAKTFAGTVFITKDGQIVYSLPAKDKKIVAIKEVFPNLKKAQVKGEEKAITKVNYFIGKDQSKWRRNIPTYEQVKVGEIAEGIELKLKAYGNKVEKLFFVKPFAEAGEIRVKVEGAKGLRISEGGKLVVETELGEVEFSKPVAFQEAGGKREYVDVAYALVDKETYSFRVGEYDRNGTLVIDPVVASTFLGGGDDDEAFSIAIDNDGNVFIAGETNSDDFPTEGNPHQDTYAGSGDTFVSKLSPDLSKLLVSTFLGGSGSDNARAIAIDPTGNVFVAGYTYSNDFPLAGNPYQDTYARGGDVFVSKLNSDLSNLLASTFLGGRGFDIARAIAIDPTGNVFVTGYTGSSDFPTEGNPYQDARAGSTDAFVSKLSPDLSRLLASTFLGGSSNSDYAYSIAIDNNGNVFVTGYTYSDDFPIAGNPYQGTYAGADAFVSKLSPDLSQLLASTFLGGGSSYDYAYSIAIDNDGNVFVTGITGSDDFPTEGNPYQDARAGSTDTFVSKLSPDLSQLLASTFLGGGDYDYAYAIGIDYDGNVFITGYTYSDDFPLAGNPYQNTRAGERDAFVSKLSPDLSKLLVSTFLGGGNYDIARAIAIDNDGNVFVTGITGSDDFPTEGNPYQDARAGRGDVFVSKLPIASPVPQEEEEEVEERTFGSAKFEDGTYILIDGGGAFTSADSFRNAPYNCSVPSGINVLSSWYSFVVKLDRAGGTAVIKLVFPSDLPDGIRIGKCTREGFKYLPPENVEVIGNSTVVITIKDGSEFDYDGRVDGYVRDPVAIIEPPQQSQPEPQPEPQPQPEPEEPTTPPSEPTTSGGGGGGCSTGGSGLLFALLFFAVPILRRLGR